MVSLNVCTGGTWSRLGRERVSRRRFSLQQADGHFSVLPSGPAPPQQWGSWEGRRDRDATAGSVQGVLHHRYCVPFRDRKVWEKTSGILGSLQIQLKTNSG